MPPPIFLLPSDDEDEDDGPDDIRIDRTGPVPVLPDGAQASSSSGPLGSVSGNAAREPRPIPQQQPDGVIDDVAGPLRRTRAVRNLAALVAPATRRPPPPHRRRAPPPPRSPPATPRLSALPDDGLPAIDSPLDLSANTSPSPPAPTPPQHHASPMPGMFAGTAGGQMDMSHLMSTITELSGQLQANREAQAEVLARAEAIREEAMAARAAGAAALVNGDGANPLAEENARLREEVRFLKERVQVSEANGERLDKQCGNLSTITYELEMCLTKVMEGLRVYAHQQSDSIVNIHRNYNHQLASERQVNMESRLAESERQQSYINMGENLRGILRTLGDSKMEAKYNALLIENKNLRMCLGVDDDGNIREDVGRALLFPADYCPDCTARRTEEAKQKAEGEVKDEDKKEDEGGDEEKDKKDN